MTARIFRVRLSSGSDVRLGLRLIRKQPLMAAAVVLALGTAIGLATASYTFLDALRRGRLPFHGGERFVRLLSHSRKDGPNAPIGLDRYRALRGEATRFGYLGAMRAGDVNLLLGERVETCSGVFMTPGFFAHLPHRPLIGRPLQAADGLPGAAPVLLIRESLWERRLGGDRGVLGSTLRIGGVPHEVVGVMPDAFEFPRSGAELWIPIDDLYLGGSPAALDPSTRLFGVLAEGATLAGAQEQVDVVSRRLDAGVAGADEVRIRVAGYTDLSSLGIDTLLAGFLASTIVVLLVVASNVATLVLARTSARSTELAIRSALGASRTRLVFQVWIEIFLLGAIAAALGLAASTSALSFVEAGMGDDLPFWVDFTPRLTTAAFVAVVTLLATLVGGAGPALAATRGSLVPAIRSGCGAGASRAGRLGGVMIAAETALSVALLTVAAVLADGVARYAEPGSALPKGQVLTAQVYVGDLPAEGDSDKEREESLRQAISRKQRRLSEALSRLPGVDSHGFATHLPRMTPRPRDVLIESALAGMKHARIHAPSVGVGAGLLETLGGSATAGRLFVAGDFEPGAPPVVIVNQPFVDRFLGGRDPVGRRLRVVAGDAEPAWREIVGVVPDLGLVVGDSALAAGYYEPMRGPSLFRLALRSRGDPRLLTEPLRRAAYDVDPGIVVNRIVPLEDVAMDDRVALNAIGAAMAGISAAALLLSLLGTYAIVSFTVTRRTREIGIRLALGAGALRIVRSIVGRTTALLALGGVSGALAGVVLSRVLASILVAAIPASGAGASMAVLGLFAVVGIAACWSPVRRALAIPPRDALAAE